MGNIPKESIPEDGLTREEKNVIEALVKRTRGKQKNNKKIIFKDNGKHNKERGKWFRLEDKMPVNNGRHPLLLKMRGLSHLIIGYYFGFNVFCVDNEYSHYYPNGVVEPRDVLYWLDIPPLPPLPPEEIEVENFKDKLGEYYL